MFGIEMTILKHSTFARCPCTILLFGALFRPVVCVARNWRALMHLIAHPSVAFASGLIPKLIHYWNAIWVWCAFMWNAIRRRLKQRTRHTKLMWLRKHNWPKPRETCKQTTKQNFAGFFSSLDNFCIEPKKQLSLCGTMCASVCLA